MSNSSTNLINASDPRSGARSEATFVRSEADRLPDGAKKRLTRITRNKAVSANVNRITPVVEEVPLKPHDVYVRTTNWRYIPYPILITMGEYYKVHACISL